MSKKEEQPDRLKQFISWVDGDREPKDRTLFVMEQRPHREFRPSEEEFERREKDRLRKFFNWYPIAAAGIDIAALMEGAACESIAPYLAEGETSVGVSLQLFHTAATPVGMEVRAESVVTAVDGKKITFTVTAYDEAGEIGHAQHERVIVKAERFLEKTYDKL